MIALASPFARVWRRLRYGTPVVVVSGLPRSGTSMAMKMLEAGGLLPLTDGVREADIDNPKGYYELERVKDLHQDDDTSWVRDARGRVIKVISFLLKDLPRNLNYKVILMHRPVDEVIASQNKMLERRGEANDLADEEARELLVDQIARARAFLRHAPHMETLEVPYREAIADPRTQAERIARFLGGGLDVDRMSGVVDEKLYRNRAS